MIDLNQMCESLQNRNTQKESELVRQAVAIVEKNQSYRYDGLRHHLRRCRIALAVRNGVDDLALLVQA